MVSSPTRADIVTEQNSSVSTLLKEGNGKFSSMRLMSFIALIASIVFAAMTLQNKNPEGKYITTIFMLGAFAPKALQKFAEQKLG